MIYWEKELIDAIELAWRLSLRAECWSLSTPGRILQQGWLVMATTIIKLCPQHKIQDMCRVRNTFSYLCITHKRMHQRAWHWHAAQKAHYNRVESFIMLVELAPIMVSWFHLAFVANVKWYTTISRKTRYQAAEYSFKQKVYFRFQVGHSFSMSWMPADIVTALVRSELNT